jgi:nucleoside-diphosphate-sugar epimerase
MRALVTGGGGFLGLGSVRALLQAHQDVRSFSRHRHRALDELGVEQRQGDLSNPEAADSAVAGCDIVYHAAAKAGVWGPHREYHEANVVGTKNIIDACRKQGVSRLVYTSSPSVIFNGRDMDGVDESVPYPAHYEAAYPQTKAEAEQCVRAASSDSLATVSLRPHLIWGPGDSHLLPRLVDRARAGQLRKIGSESKRIDTIYIDNAVDAHLWAAQCLAPDSAVAGKVYFVSQDEPIELWEMVNRMLKTAGVAPVERSIPRSLAMALAWMFETWHRIRRNPEEPRLTRFVVRELSTSHWFDISAAK